MKMAKSSDADLSMAMDLANVLDDIERGYFPAKLSDDPESEETEWIDTNDRKQYAKLVYGLTLLLNKGSISRVIWGMAVVCDPENECIDPDADTIEHHPKRQQLEKQRDELLAALVNSRNCLESANEMGDGPIVDTIWYGRAETLFDYMDNAIASVRGNHPEQPLDMVETTAPAIVFYPAGSLGEEVQP